ncbi:MAG: hypothetical protein EDM82_13505 [Cyanobacteria bacterium CYA]|nr:MAG: hypothetical protein EDM82_13505 [Cyanobacteria bacterium CYA]
MQSTPAQALSEVAVQPGDGREPADSTSHVLSTFLIGFGTLLLLLTLFRMMRTSRGRLAAGTKDPREVIAHHRAVTNAAREPIESVMAEANELAVRLVKMLDAKAARLELLMEQADERLARLDQLAPVPTAAPAAPATSMSSGPGSVERQVLEMAEKGCDSAQIARRVNRSVGEIELILALRR